MPHDLRLSTPHGIHPAGASDAPEPARAYGVDRITLLVRDPHWLFAFWEVTPEALARAREALGEDARLVVCILDLGPARFDPPGPLADVGPFGVRALELPVNDAIGDWHVPVPGAAHAYRAELGLKASRAFWRFAQSNVVATPSGRVFDGDEHADDAAWLSLEALYRAAAISGDRSSSIWGKRH